MSILHRNHHPSSSSTTTSQANENGSTKSIASERAPSSGQVPLNQNRKRKKEKSSRSSKLLWVIGAIAVLVAVLNYANTLAHHGVLPTGLKLTISFGDQQDTIYHLGLKKRHNNSLNDHERGLHYLPPPTKDIKKMLAAKKNQGLHQTKFQKIPGDAKAAREASLEKKPINGPQLQHQKERAKGKVHHISYYLQISQERGHDKERLLHLLRDNAGIRQISETTYEQLPTWSQITSLYGDRPRLQGLNQCEKFRSNGDVADKYLGVAGAFNSGTNLLSKMLVRNCVLHKRQAKYGSKHRGVRWQVPYGKHTPPADEEFRNTHMALKSGGVDAREVLPVVAIRSPSFWLQSMCSHHYTSRWPRVFRRGDINYHCPNLYPIEAEKIRMKELGAGPFRGGSQEALITHVRSFNRTKSKAAEMFIGILPKKKAKKAIQDGAKSETNADDDKTENNHRQQQTVGEAAAILTEEELNEHYFPVHIKYSNFSRVHRSLVHFYNEWNREYLDLEDEYPNVMVRMEDLLFFPDEVIPQICECAGGQMVYANLTAPEKKHVQVAAESAKAKHTTAFMEEGEEHTGYVDALIKYGNSDNRLRGLTPQDIQYANRHLDRKIMDLFGYEMPNTIKLSNQ